MKRPNLYMQNFRAPQGDDGGEGGGGGEGGDTLTLSAQELQDKIDEAVNKEVKGLQSKNQELIGKQKKLKEQLAQWDGMDNDSVRGLLTQLEENEELQLITQGKHEEVFERRTEKLRSKYTSQLDETTKRMKELETQLGERESRIKTMTIDQQVKDAFTKEGGVATALPDVVTRAHGTFDIEEGLPVARDADGDLISGEEGPLTVRDWVRTLKRDAPHLFPQSRGAGMNGSGSGGSASLEGLSTNEFMRQRREQLNKQKEASR